MAFYPRGLAFLLTVITIVLGILLAGILLLFGVGNLVKPDVSPSYLAQNTRVCIAVILTGLVCIYAVIRPYLGGFLLFICAVVLSVVFGGFFRNPITGGAVLLGVLSVIRGRLSRRITPDDREQASPKSTGT